MISNENADSEKSLGICSCCFEYIRLNLSTPPQLEGTMSHLLDDDTETETSENDDYCDSNDADSLHFEEEEEDDRNPFPPMCRPSERLLGGSIILHIDQANSRNDRDSASVGCNTDRSGFPLLRTPFENNSGSLSYHASGSSIISQLPLVQPSTSTTTSLSEAASDTASTRAVMGDTPSATTVNQLQGEDDVDNSSQNSTADTDAERVRRIHNTIFSSLEHDLAELVRIREETIQFLECGTRSVNDLVSSNNESQSSATSGRPQTEPAGAADIQNEEESSNAGEGTTHAAGGTGDNTESFFLRERLMFHARPFGTNNANDNNAAGNSKLSNTNADPNTITMGGRSYTPIAKFDNAPAAKPAKPYLEVGLTTCEEKASAARKVFDKLQYGDPEDESACFIRRFWRESSTQAEASQEVDLPMTIDAASIAQRTASLQASLEEAFGGLRLRLQQVQSEASTNQQCQTEERRTEGTVEGGEGDTGESIRESGSENTAANNINSSNAGESLSSSNDPMSYYQNWDEETSIMNNPLNYDIWNELDESGDPEVAAAGSSITARINHAESSVYNSSAYGRSRSAVNTNSNSLLRTSTIAVGPDGGEEGSSSGYIAGAELDEEDDDEDDENDQDERVLTVFRFTDPRNIRNRSSEVDNGPSRSDELRDFSPATREFFQDIGISEELGRDLFNMFTLSEEDIPVPFNGNSDDMPEPLFPRNNSRNRNSSNNALVSEEMPEEDDDLPNFHAHLVSGCSDEEGDDEDEDLHSVIPQVPLADATECPLFAPIREDDCSTRVYLDEHDISFPHTHRSTVSEDNPD